ncbi:MAG: 50S ribosomal protein L6 [Candidatus Omnitrophota bacterium]
MSRIGKLPIKIESAVEVTQNNGSVTVKGPKGKLELSLPSAIKLDIKDSTVLVLREKHDKKTKSMHGTIRALLNNMVLGVTRGFKKELDIIGVGYKAQLKGQQVLVLSMGFAHLVEMQIPSGLKLSTPSPTKIIIEGIDKHGVGEFAAKVRRVYPPEPYKGKGIRYTGEEVRKKLGKALAK